MCFYVIVSRDNSVQTYQCAATTVSPTLCLALDSNFNSICVSSHASEVNEDDGHIIAAFALRALDIRTAACIQPILTDLCDFNFPLHLQVDMVYYTLVGVNFPDAVAAHYDKVNFRSDRELLHVWESSDCLVFHRQARVPLVGQVSHGSGQIQVAVDAALQVHS